VQREYDDRLLTTFTAFMTTFTAFLMNLEYNMLVTGKQLLHPAMQKDFIVDGIWSTSVISRYGGKGLID
jgi:hypothetical protein